jgi:hypothetical protein
MWLCPFTGAVLQVATINKYEGGGLQELEEYDLIGTSIATIGDVNLDGVQDLVVGAFNRSDGDGALFILLMESTGVVSSYSEIASPDEALRTHFGLGVSSVGSLDTRGEGVRW